VRRVRPLRRIVGELDLVVGGTVTALHLLLECGHVVPRRTDRVERAAAHRRRCKKCQKRARVDVDLRALPESRRRLSAEATR
jgi:hypothetical protein